MESEQSEQPQPVGDPPSYSEIVKHQSVETPRAEECDESMNAKQPKWADQTSSLCQPAHPSHYPPSFIGPAPYGPAYGQPPMFAYCQQPGYGMPCCGVAASQHPQQQVMMVDGQHHHQPVLIQHVQSYGGYIVLSCIVTFCCNFILGFIAFILAIMASSMAVTDPKNARQLGHASLGVSIGGILVSILIIIVMFGVAISGPGD